MSPEKFCEPRCKGLPRNIGLADVGKREWTCPKCGRPFLVLEDKKITVTPRWYATNLMDGR